MAKKTYRKKVAKKPRVKSRKLRKRTKIRGGGGSNQQLTSISDYTPVNTVVTQPQDTYAVPSEIFNNHPGPPPPNRLLRPGQTDFPNKVLLKNTDFPNKELLKKMDEKLDKIISKLESMDDTPTEI